MNQNNYYDIYLYKINKPNNLIKIPHITYDEASRCGWFWFTYCGDDKDYMLVTEGSTPWSMFEKSKIVEKELHWALNELDPNTIDNILDDIFK